MNDASAMAVVRSINLPPRKGGYSAAAAGCMESAICDFAIGDARQRNANRSFAERKLVARA